MSRAPMHEPGPQHRRLQENAGKWNVHCKYFMGPDTPPMEIRAVETVEAFGAFWTVGHFEADMMGMPFHGRATLGYDPTTQRWISTWIDNMTPYLFHFEGEQVGGNELRFAGKGPMPQTGEQVDYRSVERWNEDGTRTFSMFCSGTDGNEFQIFEYTYSRAD